MFPFTISAYDTPLLVSAWIRSIRIFVFTGFGSSFSNPLLLYFHLFFLNNFHKSCHLCFNFPSVEIDLV
ncbi:hypothetical protein HanRHA438_Chr14g0682841 [Helianthus annuus]|nr:hypothetical protein HanIR_Chr14g0728491 [Helianthus annuus]KAJ0856306.1 hypothetical protein HanRHA438_Chr14g0682841 [Helianthus annuus]